MKVTLEITTPVLAGVVTYLYQDRDGDLRMSTTSISTDDMNAGAVIDCRALSESEG